MLVLTSHRGIRNVCGFEQGVDHSRERVTVVGEETSVAIERPKTTKLLFQGSTYFIRSFPLISFQQPYGLVSRDCFTIPRHDRQCFGDMRCEAQEQQSMGPGGADVGGLDGRACARVHSRTLSLHAGVYITPHKRTHRI